MMNALRRAVEATSSSSHQALRRARTAMATALGQGDSRAQQQRRRRKLVILGTGWSSYSLLRNVSKRLYDVIVISPRNHFLFTPLLASTTVGTLEFRSIIEPIRNVGFRSEHHFHLARATRLDLEDGAVQCVSELDPSREYSVSYDALVIGVGAVSNDFNVPGVKQHAFFLKVRILACPRAVGQINYYVIPHKRVE